MLVTKTGTKHEADMIRAALSMRWNVPFAVAYSLDSLKWEVTADTNGMDVPKHLSDMLEAFADGFMMCHQRDE